MERFRYYLDCLFSAFEAVEDESIKIESLRMLEATVREMASSLLFESLENDANRTVTREAECIILQTYGSEWINNDLNQFVSLTSEEVNMGNSKMCAVSQDHNDSRFSFNECGSKEIIAEDTENSSVTEFPRYVHELNTNEVFIHSDTRASLDERMNIQAVEINSEKLSILSSGTIQEQSIATEKNFNNDDESIDCLILAHPIDEPSISNEILKSGKKDGDVWRNSKVGRPRKGSNLVCSDCGFVANNRKHLYRHGKESTHITQPRINRVHKCSMCKYSTTVKFNLKRHFLRCHSLIKSFLCSSCGRAFKDVDAMKNHIKYLHERNRKIQCHVCPKKFVTSSDLHRHQRLCHFAPIMLSVY